MQEEQLGGDEKEDEEGNVGEKRFNSADENKSEGGIDNKTRTNTVGNNRKRERKALREASPACDYFFF